jgi:hypothetical protein
MSMMIKWGMISALLTVMLFLQGCGAHAGFSIG